MLLYTYTACLVQIRYPDKFLGTNNSTHHNLHLHCLSIHSPALRKLSSKTSNKRNKKRCGLPHKWNGKLLYVSSDVPTAFHNSQPKTTHFKKTVKYYLITYLFSEILKRYVCFNQSRYCRYTLPPLTSRTHCYSYCNFIPDSSSTDY
jgi:hypothetical protein